MGSPGVFIHSGTLGGRFCKFSVAADVLRPPRLPATTAPPTTALPFRRNRRRDVAATPLPTSVGSVIARAPLEFGTPGVTHEVLFMFHAQGIVIVVHQASRRLPRVAAPVSIF